MPNAGKSLEKKFSLTPGENTENGTIILEKFGQTFTKLSIHTYTNQQLLESFYLITKECSLVIR